MTPMPEHLPTDSDRANACTTGRFNNSICEFCRATHATESILVQSERMRVPEPRRACRTCKTTPEVVAITVRARRPLISFRVVAPPVAKPQPSPVTAPNRPFTRDAVKRPAVTAQDDESIYTKLHRMTHEQQQQFKRQAVVDLLAKAGEPMTAGQIALKLRLPSFGGVSVGRSLRTLPKSRIRRDGTANPATYELVGGHFDVAMPESRYERPMRTKTTPEDVAAAMDVLRHAGEPMTSLQILTALGRDNAECMSGSLTRALKRERPDGLEVIPTGDSTKFRAATPARQHLVPAAVALKPESDDADILVVP